MPHSQVDNGMNSYYNESIFVNLTNNAAASLSSQSNNFDSTQYNDTNPHNVDTNESSPNNSRPIGVDGNVSNLPIPIDKPLTELCVGDIVNIIKQAVMPMNTQLTHIENYDGGSGSKLHFSRRPLLIVEVAAMVSPSHDDLSRSR